MQYGNGKAYMHGRLDTLDLKKMHYCVHDAYQIRKRKNADGGLRDPFTRNERPRKAIEPMKEAAVWDLLKTAHHMKANAGGIVDTELMERMKKEDEKSIYNPPILTLFRGVLADKPNK